ncbi:MAG: hypothetical protein DSY59_01495 [Persephonella sp.]|nr:MAG: hypothetical protein DSY60_03300 [Persephonella sp.]RUM61563.1 MAG: hypothetical protein DSY59_01495 [Persephonella sp.]
MKKRIFLQFILLYTLNSYSAFALSCSNGSNDSSSTGQSSSARTASDVQTTITHATKRDENKQKVSGVGLSILYNSKVILDTEKGDATVKRFDITDRKNKRYDADVEAGIFSYSKDLRDNLTVGIILPYRKIKVKDDVKTKLTTHSISPFVSFRTMKKGKFYNDLSFYGFLSLNTLKTKLDFDNKRDKIDYKELGFGATVNPTYKFNSMLTGDLSFGYQYSTYMIRKSDITLTDNLDKDFVRKSFKPRHLINIGTSLTVYPIENSKVILGYMYSSNVLGEQKIKEERANYYYIKAYYTLWLFKFGLGYKKTDDANNYEEDTYMISASLNF